MRYSKRFGSNESGATSIEYAFMAGLIIAVCIVGIATFGFSVNDLFGLSASEITSAFGG